MTSDGAFILVQQSGTAGFFADVAVRLSVENGDANLTVSFAADISSDWRVAVEFGLAYAREHLPRVKKSGKRMSVEVMSVKGHAVDTTMMALAFASAKALWDAIEHPGPVGFKLDPSARVFHVPK